jgi:hypothetical protein
MNAMRRRRRTGLREKISVRSLLQENSGLPDANDHGDQREEQDERAPGIGAPAGLVSCVFRVGDETRLRRISKPVARGRHLRREAA